MFKSNLARNLKNPQMLALIGVILVISITIYFFGSMLAPVFLAIGLAYLLNFPINFLINRGFKRGYAIASVFLVLFTTIYILFVRVTPLLIQQATKLTNDFPEMMNNLKSLIQDWQVYLSPYVSPEYINNFVNHITDYFKHSFQFKVDKVFNLISNVIYIAFNVFFVPFMALLMLVDYGKITKSIAPYLPEQRELTEGVFSTFMNQLNNYVKGKVIEMIIMSVVSFIAFVFFGLNYNLIISLIIGASVIIPYVGIIICSVPLVIVSYLQFDLTSTFWWILGIHIALQLADGNILVPMLFSKANNLSPFTIVLSVLVFGQIWGVVGVFLAIPLATLVKALGDAWLKTLGDTVARNRKQISHNQNNGQNNSQNNSKNHSQNNSQNNNQNHSQNHSQNNQQASKQYHNQNNTNSFRVKDYTNVVLKAVDNSKQSQNSKQNSKQDSSEQQTLSSSQESVKLTKSQKRRERKKRKKAATKQTETFYDTRESQSSNSLGDVANRSGSISVSSSTSSEVSGLSSSIDKLEQEGKTDKKRKRRKKKNNREYSNNYNLDGQTTSTYKSQQAFKSVKTRASNSYKKDNDASQVFNSGVFGGNYNENNMFSKHVMSDHEKYELNTFKTKVARF